MSVAHVGWAHHEGTGATLLLGFVVIFGVPVRGLRVTHYGAAGHRVTHYGSRGLRNTHYGAGGLKVTHYGPRGLKVTHYCAQGPRVTHHGALAGVRVRHQLQLGGEEAMGRMEGRSGQILPLIRRTGNAALVGGRQARGL